MSLKQTMYLKLLAPSLIALSLINLSVERVSADEREIETILERLDGAKESCNKCNTVEQWRLLTEADTRWQGLSDDDKKKLIQRLLERQLESGSPKPEIVVVWDEGETVRGARVTGENGTVKITLGDDLKARHVAGIAPFLCYEAEVARIRAQVQRQCNENNNKRMKAEILRYLSEAYKNVTGEALRRGTDIFDAIDGMSPDEKERVYIDAYQALMDRFNDDRKYYASWMFEKIVNEQGKGDDKSCDLRLDATYDWDAAVNKAFTHDIDAKQRAREHCDCPKYKLKINIATEGSCPEWGYFGTVFIRVGPDVFLVPVDPHEHEYYTDVNYITDKESPPKVELVHSEGIKKICEEKRCPQTRENCRFSIHHVKWVPTEGGMKGKERQEDNSVIVKEEDKDLMREDYSQKIFFLKVHFYLRCDCPEPMQEKKRAPIRFKIRVTPPGGPSESPQDEDD